MGSGYSLIVIGKLITRSLTRAYAANGSTINEYTINEINLSVPAFLLRPRLLFPPAALRLRLVLLLPSQ